MRINLRNLVTVPSYGDCPCSCMDVSLEEAIRFDRLSSAEERSLSVCGFLSWDESKCRSAVEAQVNVGVLSEDAARRVLGEVSRRREAMAEEDARAMEAMANPLGVFVPVEPEAEQEAEAGEDAQEVEAEPEAETEPEVEAPKAKGRGGRPRKEKAQ